MNKREKINKVSKWLDMNLLFFTRGQILSIPFIITGFLTPFYVGIPLLFIGFNLGSNLLRLLIQ
jgi:hypothetical protein